MVMKTDRLWRGNRHENKDDSQTSLSSPPPPSLQELKQIDAQDLAINASTHSRPGKGKYKSLRFKTCHAESYETFEGKEIVLR